MYEKTITVSGTKLKVKLPTTVDTDIDFAMQGGTIHPPDKSGGILYPSTPRYKISSTTPSHQRINASGSSIQGE